MNRLPALLAALAACVSLAQGAAPQDTIAVDFALEPQKVHEECMRVEAGQAHAYHWKSNVPVDFNIHYHRDKDVFFPVKRDAMRGDGGTFVAKTGEDYCWMWTARDQPARVEGQVKQR